LKGLRNRIISVRYVVNRSGKGQTNLFKITITKHNSCETFYTNDAISA